MAQAEVAAAGTVQAAVILLDMVQAAPTTAVLPAVVLPAVVLPAAAVPRAVTLDHCVDFTLKSMTMFMRKWRRAQPTMVHLADLRVEDLLADTLPCGIHRAMAVRVGVHQVGVHPVGAHLEVVPITAVVIPMVVRSVILTAVAVLVHR